MFEINGQQIHDRDPICGWEWLFNHKHDHSHDEIEALAIEVSFDGRNMAPVLASEKRGKVKAAVRGLRDAVC